MKKSISRCSLIIVFALAVLMLGATMLPVTAQAPVAQNDDPARALVSELRQLRVAIENLTSSNSRVQILAMRATQHEQRLASLSDQLLKMKTQLVEVSAESFNHETVLAQLQERLRIESDPNRRQHLELEQQQMRGVQITTKMKQAALQAEVNQLTQQTAAEESRLNEVQQRLDETERSLRR